MDELEELVWKHSLKNRVEYGKGSPGAIAGKVIAEKPGVKGKMKQLMVLIGKKTSEANKLSDSKAQEELAKYFFAEKKEEGEKMWQLRGCEKGKVVTRFLPEPNGLLHLGHAKAGWLSSTLAQQWQGKFLLRFDDTNPEKEKEEFVEAIKKDLEWLGLKFDGKEAFSSDFMPHFYKLAEKLLSKGKGYVCSCSKEEMTAGREKKKGCACRKRSSKENVSLWKQMLSGELKQGSAIVRFVGGMASDNPVMRDPTLFRIMENPHFRQGGRYKVWPTYDFEASVADSLSGVTHALRSKEYELRDELYYALLEALELRKPVVYDFSRLNVKGSTLSKRNIKPLVDEGKLLGWDDPRLLTIGGLKRRGVLPLAIKNFVLSFGLSKVESSPSEEKLLVENRRMLDPFCERRYFVDSPVELSVKNHPKQLKSVRVANHSFDKSKGGRELKATGSYYVMGSDASQLKKGELFRLKELYNLKLVEKKAGGAMIAEVVEGGQMPQNKIQWVPKGEAVACKLLVPKQLFDENGHFISDSLLVRAGFCEKSCEKLGVGTVLQFERVGFARLDSNSGEELVFIFSC